MKCPKCKTGKMVPETDITGRKLSERCFICGERIYNDFKVRKPAAIEKQPCNGLRTTNPRRMLTERDKSVISENHAAGMSRKKIAELLGRPEGTVSNYIERTIKGGNP